MLEHLSYSSISTYLSCPAYWQFKYVDKKPSYSSPELAFGTAFHGTLEKYLSGEMVVDGNTKPIALLDLWSSEWQKASTNTERGEIFWGTDTPESFCNDGVRMFSHSAIVKGVESIRAQYHGNGIERKVELRVPGVPIPIIGYIDITLANGVPADFKTSRQSWSQDRAQGELQSLFYLAALNQIVETVPGWKFKHFIFVKTKTPQFQELEHTHKPAEVFWLFGMIRKVWMAIEADVFPENPSAWRCGAGCDFWKYCRGK